jgi:hypothetical protein
MGTLEDLPSEVIVHIYTQLPIPDRLALSRVRLLPIQINGSGLMNRHVRSFSANMRRLLRCSMIFN